MPNAWRRRIIRNIHAPMSAMRVQRYGYGPRRQGISLGCGCSALLVVMGVLACAGIYAFSSTPLLTGLALEITGAQRLGRTDDLFAPHALPAAPAPALAGAVAVPRLNLNLGSYGQHSLEAALPEVRVITGANSAGTPAAQATFTENGLLQLCNQRGNICTNGDSRYRDIRFDLRPGGAVIYAEVNAGLWQRVGVVIRLNANRTRFEVAGVDVGGVLYDPASLPGELRTFVREIGRVGNDALRQLALDAGGRRYTLESIMIDDNTLTLILR